MGGFHHKEGNDARCDICSHEHRLLIEDQYTRVYPLKDIVQDFDIANDRALTKHCRANKLDDVRARNTDGALRLIVEKGVEMLENDELTIDANLFLRALRLTAEKQGEVGAAKQDGGGNTYILMAGPLPGGGLPDQHYPVIEIKAKPVEDDPESKKLASDIEGDFTRAEQELADSMRTATVHHDNGKVVVVVDKPETEE